MASGAQDGARVRPRRETAEVGYHDGGVIQEGRGVLSQIERLDHAIERAEKAFSELHGTIDPVLIRDENVPAFDTEARISRSNVTDSLASLTDRVDRLGAHIRQATNEVDL